MFVGQTPKFPSDSIFGKKNQPSSYLEAGETSSARQVMNFLDFAGGFLSKFFQRDLQRGQRISRGVEAEMGHNKYGYV